MLCKSDSRIQTDSLSVLCATTCLPLRGAYSYLVLDIETSPNHTFLGVNRGCGVGGLVTNLV